MKKFFTICAIILLVIILGWYFYIHSNNTSNFLSMEKKSFNSDIFSYSIQSTKRPDSAMDLTVTEIPLVSETENRKIYFYFDKDYPVLGTSVNSATGIYNHVLAEFEEKNVSAEIMQVDSAGLPAALQDNNSIVISSNGVLPDTVYSPTKNLVTPWIRNGGTLIWVGDGLGYYYGVKGAEIKSQDSQYKIGWSGQVKILGGNFLEGPNTTEVANSQGDTPTPLAMALGIKSTYTLTGAFVSSLTKTNNADLGYHYDFGNDSRTSLSQIKIGNGSIFLFGSMLLNREIDVAWDISQILASGFINADISKISTRKLTIGDTDNIKLDRELNVGNNEKVRVIIFSTDYAKRFFLSQDFTHE